MNDDFSYIDIEEIDHLLIRTRPKFEDLYQQEAVYIEKKLAEAINKIAKKKGRGGKMAIYNAALKLYLQKLLSEAKGVK